MSAIIEEDGHNEPVKVLITMHEGMDAMDAIGPLEVFTSAQHNAKDPGEFTNAVSKPLLRPNTALLQNPRPSVSSSRPPKSTSSPPRAPLCAPTSTSTKP